MKKHITKFNNDSSLNIETKAVNDKKVLTIKGYGNVSTIDRGRELMPKECWDLKNYLINPVICINHDTKDINSLVGKATFVEARPEGLYFEAEIGAEGEELTPAQATVVKLVRQGILKTLSVGFIPHDYETDKKTGVLTYKRAELLEISLVTVPMNQDSVLTSIKEFNGEVLESTTKEETTEEVKEIAEVKEESQTLQHVEEVEKILDAQLPVEEPTEEVEEEDEEMVQIQAMLLAMSEQINKIVVDIEMIKSELASSKEESKSYVRVTNYEQDLTKVSKLLKTVANLKK
jgi:HK97 family phage prohead protease